ncbi:hypothetical protein AVEN_171845-1 [Araneus ventricosus]|uniref:Uncharacterized protein n=1 Tax=Araneus ventricosus TaxID=182803 RepID=A0A4Y2F8P0_ARAVE|nr:hypothetical protein AVEN_171845-1 [Araneus ventricosus]
MDEIWLMALSSEMRICIKFWNNSIDWFTVCRHVYSCLLNLVTQKPSSIPFIADLYQISDPVGHWKDVSNAYLNLFTYGEAKDRTRHIVEVQEKV